LKNLLSKTQNIKSSPKKSKIKDMNYMNSNAKIILKDIKKKGEKLLLILKRKNLLLKKMIILKKMKKKKMKKLNWI